jgi:hypothetical protein
LAGREFAEPWLLLYKIPALQVDQRKAYIGYVLFNQINLARKGQDSIHVVDVSEQAGLPMLASLFHQRVSSE